MSDQIRSADLLVKTALSDQKTMDALREHPEETLKELAREATGGLPRVLLEPDKPTNNLLWLLIVGAFALVMLWSAYILGSSVTIKLEAGATYVTKGETILTLFTTVVAFLAGLLSPSPIKK